MHDPYEHDLPEELQEVAGQLRRERAQASALDLDRIKLRALHQSTGARAGQKGHFMKSRLATLLTVGLLTVGAGGTFAIARGGHGHGDGGSAAAAKHHGNGNGNDCGKDKKQGKKKCGDDQEEQGQYDNDDNGDHGDNGHHGGGDHGDHGD